MTKKFNYNIDVTITTERSDDLEMIFEIISYMLSTLEAFRLGEKSEVERYFEGQYILSFPLYGSSRYGSDCMTEALKCFCPVVDDPECVNIRRYLESFDWEVHFSHHWYRHRVVHKKGVSIRDMTVITKRSKPSWYDKVDFELV